VRFHHDHSVLLSFYNHASSLGLSKAAFSLNNHIGFEAGGDGQPGPADAHMVGTSLVTRL
jgi:hypothetical protein